MSNSYYQHTRFLIIAPTRSGGTLLSHALDSHYEIYCHRGEPMHSQNPIRKLSRAPYDAIDTCLSMLGYQAAGCKLTYEQLQSVGYKALLHLKVDRVIHLWRDNPLDKIISEAVRLADKQNDLGTHTREARPLQTIQLNPKQVIRDIGEYWQDFTEIRRVLRATMSKDSYLEIEYNKLNTFGLMLDRDLGFKLQQFLCVSDLTMLRQGLVKRNPYSQKEIIENYDELKEYISHHAYQYLKYFTDSTS